ncbi:MAG TPA: hypothetical protein VGG66_07190 [Rhizomicrobium sp.]
MGRKANGGMVSIDAVGRGLDCQCFCPQCDSPLIAVQGDILQHHFRHYSDTCHGAAETALHLFAKQIIRESLFLELPELYEPIGRVVSATLEHHLGDCVPDVLLQYDTGETIAVEIWVAHQVPPAKVGVYRDRQMGVVEIDLRAYVTAQKSDAQWADIVLLDAPRKWLSPPRAVWLRSRADPRNHYCDHPGCLAWGSFGFARAWFCFDHRADGDI